MRAWLESLGGVTDEAPRGAPSLESPAWALIWCAMVAIVIAFCGQSSRFIYIDF